MASRVAPGERERLAAHAGAEVYRQAGETAHASRALASYAEIADIGERSGLRELLGFDIYA